MDLYAELGGQSLSFGSPKNRVRARVEMDKAISVVAPFFGKLAGNAKTANILVCIELI